jgi:hypothetical protein
MEPTAAVPRLVCVASYLNTCEADLARAVLAAEDIPAWLENANMVQWCWKYSNAVGGVKLFVSDAQAQLVREILESPKSKKPAFAPPVDSAIRPLGLRFRYAALEKAVFRAYSAAVFGVLFPPLVLYAVWILMTLDRPRGQRRPRELRRQCVAWAFSIGWISMYTLALL